MLEMIPYNRDLAVRYAHTWAYSRNPNYYDYEFLGGDCTNYASQCLYAGVPVMNFMPTFGWYYLSGNDKAPAWTGVPFFFNFITRGERSEGPFGVETSIYGLEMGDFVQFRYPEKEPFGHTPVVVEVGYPRTPETVLVAAHSEDADWRPLSTYPYEEIRYMHILGAYREKLA